MWTYDKVLYKSDNELYIQQTLRKKKKKNDFVCDNTSHMQMYRETRVHLHKDILFKEPYRNHPDSHTPKSHHCSQPPETNWYEKNQVSIVEWVIVDNP